MASTVLIGVEQFTSSLAAASVTAGGTTAPAAGTQETWTISGSGLPAASNTASPNTGFYIQDTVVAGETILVVNISGTAMTVVRGADGTTPAAHTPTFTVVQVVAGDTQRILQGARGGELSVATFRAVADQGATDNIAAFNAAAAAAATFGTAVWIPGATSGYGLGSDWVVPAGVRVRGAGAYTFKTPGSPAGTVPSATGSMFGTVLMPSNAATITNAVVVLNGLSTSLEDVCVVGNIAGWTAGNTASAHNARSCIQVAGRGARLEHVEVWGGLGAGLDLGTGAGGNEAQDTTCYDVVANNNLNPPSVISLAGFSWTSSNAVLSCTNNPVTAGIIPGMTVSPSVNGLQVTAIVTAVTSTTVTVSNAPFNTNAGPVTLEFLGGIGIRLTSSDCMLNACRTNSASLVVGGGNTDCVNCHWSAGATTTTWYQVYVQTTGGFKDTGSVYDCATVVAGQLRRDRGIVQLTGCRFQNLNASSSAIPMLTDNEAASVTTKGALQVCGATVTVGTTSSPDGYTYLCQFSGSGTPGLATFESVSCDTGSLQHSPTVYNGGTPGISRNVIVGTSYIADVPATMDTWNPADNGLLAANLDWASAAQTSTLTAGTLYLMKVQIRGAMTWTNVWFSITTIGAGASTGSFVGLYNSAGTLLSGSADIGATLTGTTGAKSIALTTAQALAGGTFVWVAFLQNLATTQVTLQINGASVGASNVNLASAALRFAVNGTGLTALPASITPGSNTGTGSHPIAVAGN